MNFSYATIISHSTFFCFVTLLAWRETMIIRVNGGFYLGIAIAGSSIRVLYEELLVKFLVWNTKRKLKKIGKGDWADSISINLDDTWKPKE